MLIKTVRLDRQILSKSQRIWLKELKQSYISMRLEHLRANVMGDKLDKDYCDLVDVCDRLQKLLPKEVVDIEYSRIDGLFQ